jgi:hypothetical protein
MVSKPAASDTVKPMLPSRAFSFPSLTLLLLVVDAAPALADTGDTFRFAWVRGSSAERCPSEREMAERVRARLGRDPFDDAAARVIEGSVAQSDSEWRLELRVRDAEGALLGERLLASSGDDCSSLADAATLAIVLAIDPNASLDEAAARTLAAPPPKPALPVQAPPPCPPLPRPVKAPPCPKCEASALEVSLAAHGVATAGSLPRLAGGAQLTGEIALESLRFGVGAYFIPAVATDAGHMTFGLTAGFVSGCVAIGGALDLCAAVDGGVLRVSAENLAPVDPGEYAWLAAGVGPRVGVNASENLRFELGGFLLASLTRHQFVIRGVDEDFQANPVGGRLFLGARLR